MEHKKQLTELQRMTIVAICFANADYLSENVLPGELDLIAEEFNVSKRQVQRYFKSFQDQRKEGVLYPSLATSTLNRRGPASELTAELAECICEFNALEGYRLPIRPFTVKFNELYETTFSPTSMHTYCVKLGFTLVNSYIKPKLTDFHKCRRLEFILRQMTPLNDGDYMFNPILNRIHLDEKWFYVDRLNRKYRTLKDEEGYERFPDDTTQHKSHIEKLMFLAVVGVPQEIPAEYGGGYFDGKIGMFPVAEVDVAKRTSVNRPAGTEVIKSLSMTAEEYLHMITREGGVLERVRQTFPWKKEFHITIQHDNASPHVGKENTAWLACAGAEDDWNIEFITQPSQSPDLNVLDLCLFNSMQKRADVIKKDRKTLAALQESVFTQWEEYDPASITRAFALLMEVYRQVLLNGGGNQYDIPHSGITARQLAGQTVIDRFVARNVRLAGVEALDRIVNQVDDEMLENLADEDINENNVNDVAELDF
jgi:hypothetical protein